MIDETMKMPEPIIDPATSIVESTKPSPRTSFWSAAGCEIVEVSTGLNALGVGRVNLTGPNRATPKAAFHKFPASAAEFISASRERCYSRRRDFQGPSSRGRGASYFADGVRSRLVRSGAVQCRGAIANSSHRAEWAVSSVAAGPLHPKSFAGPRVHQ